MLMENTHMILGKDGKDGKTHKRLVELLAIG